LKQLIINAPILTQYNRNFELHVATDASIRGLGAVLYQIENGREKTICFYSRALRGGELNYSVIEKEALAIVMAIKKWKEYCIGRKINSYRP